MDVLSMADQGETNIELSLPNKLGAEKFVRHTLAWILPRLEFEAARIADVQTAVSEACINAIEHGNQCLPDKRFKVELSFNADHIDAVVVDDGVCAFPDCKGGPATIEEKVAGMAPARGMGLMLIGMLVDEADFVPAGMGHGNRVRMRVYRRPPSGAPRMAPLDFSGMVSP